MCRRRTWRPGSGLAFINLPFPFRVVILAHTHPAAEHPEQKQRLTGNLDVFPGEALGIL